MMQLPVTQEHGMGCAVACTAYILQLPYPRALRYFSKPTQAWGRGFYCKEIVEALAKAGKHYTYIAMKPDKKKILKVPGTIVFVGRCKKYAFGHYLVRTTRGEWMNPWSNCPSIKSAQGGFQKRLPAKALYAIFEI